MKRSMLYVMCVSWEWIYQRPQIIAERLADDFDMTVVYPRMPMDCSPKVEDTEKIKYRRVIHFPFQERTKTVEKFFVQYNQKNAFRDVDNYDYIFIGHPVYARFIPEGYKGTVIYDCMDNFEAMCEYKSYLNNVNRLEKIIVKRCSLLLATSDSLKKKMDAIAGFSKSVLCRNGTGISEVYPIKKSLIKRSYRIGYVGTISRWFDFELISDTRKIVDNIEYHLIGPVINKRTGDNIVFEGVVEHERIYEYIKDCDCLIMPFLINDIVLSVDPVKLYEYIAFGKCIISVYYPEIARFEDFVYFYHDKQEYIEIIQRLSSEGFPVKYSQKQRKDFLEQNTWECRVQEIMKYIK